MRKKTKQKNIYYYDIKENNSSTYINITNEMRNKKPEEKKK